MKSLVRKIVSMFKKPEHHHYWLEWGLTDECNHGCKVLECLCGEMVVSHRRIYGCKMDQTLRSITFPANPNSKNGCQNMHVNGEDLYY